jgi:hypothetical protein
LLLCAPLVAGCGTATRMGFGGHSRPASPVDVSVWSGPQTVRLDPGRVRPGPVLFNITNQSGRPQRFAVWAHSGRLLTQTPEIAAGQTAQVKATLSGSVAAVGASTKTASGSYVGYFARSTRLSISGRPRTGNNELTQP